MKLYKHYRRTNPIREALRRFTIGLGLSAVMMCVFWLIFWLAS